eukprot:TRINITY_DN6106_c0_g1_i1.p1 TRINITY_DN6106_c0_g1~~TRINITY_DN6106_c0_g1_i1.p1  ORF type:complete len:378 (+),score=67.66 TRINITY_DN6106_c0_g1_i1:196-1329(+)
MHKAYISNTDKQTVLMHHYLVEAVVSTQSTGTFIWIDRKIDRILTVVIVVVMADCSQLLNTGLSILHGACEHDRKGNYREAVRGYSLALEAFLSVLKMEKNDRVKNQLKEKVVEYMNRAEYLKELIANQERGEPIIKTPSTSLLPPLTSPPKTPAAQFPPVPKSTPIDAPPLSSLSLSDPISNNNNNKSSSTTRPPPFNPSVQPSAPPSLTPHTSTTFSHAQSIHIKHGQTNSSYASLFGEYLVGSKSIIVEDPYIRLVYQIHNFLRLCELFVKTCGGKGYPLTIKLATYYESTEQRDDMDVHFSEISQSLQTYNTKLVIEYNPALHDRKIQTDTGWIIKLGRGLDIYQKSVSQFSVGYLDMDLRPCLETSVDILKM